MFLPPSPPVEERRPETSAFGAFLFEEATGNSFWTNGISGMESGTKDEGRRGTATHTSPNLKQRRGYLGATQTGAGLKQEVENVAQLKAPPEAETSARTWRKERNLLDDVKEHSHLKPPLN